MKCAIVCDTAYQLYNAIRIKISQLENDDVDLLVVDQFFQAKILSDRICKESIFNRVFLLKNGNKSSDYYKSDFKFYLSKFKEVFCPNSLLCEWVGSSEKFDNYDILMFSLYMRSHIMLRILNPNAKVYFFDDGTGSYNGNVFPIGFKWHKLSYYLMHGGKRLNLEPEKIFLNYPKLAEYSHLEVKQIDDNACKFNLLNDIFDPERFWDINYKDKKFIYLTEPNDTNILNYISNENEVIKTLEAYSNITIIRPHPRLNKTVYSETTIDVDTSQLLWEYVTNNICNKEVALISDFSTAQFTPKLIFGKEPYLVFLFRIMKYEERYVDIWIKEVEKLKKIYDNPSKIYIPKDLGELKRIINALSKELVDEASK